MKTTLAFGFLFFFYTVTGWGQAVDTAAVRREVDSLIQVSRELTDKRQFVLALEVNTAAEKIALERLGRESVSYGKCCHNRGNVHAMQANAVEAEKWYLEAKTIREKVLGKGHPDYAHTVFSLGVLYDQSAQYEKAEAFYLDAIALREKILGQGHVEYMHAVGCLANLYISMDEYKKSEAVFLQLLQVQERILGKGHFRYAFTLDDLGNLYKQMGDYKQSEACFIQAREILEKSLGKGHLDYARCLNMLADLYRHMGKFDLAKSLYKESLVIKEKIIGKKHRSYIVSLSNLGNLYRGMGQLDSAEMVQIEAGSLWKEVLGPMHPYYAGSLRDLGNTYINLGNFDLAERLYENAMTIIDKTTGKTSIYYSDLLSSLATLYDLKGDYANAEKFYLEAIKIDEKIFNKDHDKFAHSFDALANLYMKMGVYKKAETLILESQGILERKLGKEHMDYANILSSLASFYWTTGDLNKADSLLTQASAIYEKSIGKNHPSYAGCLDKIAGLYQETGRLDQSRQLYEEAVFINEKVFGKAHYVYANSLAALAQLHASQNNVKTAATLFEESKSILEKALGKEHDSYIQILNTLAYFYRGNGQMDSILKLNSELYYNLAEQITNAFSFLPENAREDFIATQVQKYVDQIQSAGLKINDAAYQRLQYDIALLTKGIQLQTIQSTLKFILSQQDSSAWESYNQLTSLRRRLYAQYQLPVDERKFVDNLQARIEEKETTLARLSADFRRQQEVLKTTAADVHTALRLDEASVELIHFHTYPRRSHNTDSTLYAALILTPKDTTPIYLPLFEQRQLARLLAKTESRPEAATTLYAAAPTRQTRSGELLDSAPAYGTELYQLIWRPIDSLLRARKIKTVYFSPSGLLHRVAFAALPVNGKKVLSDRYTLRQLGSTRSLVVKTPEPVPQNYSAAVFGGVQYERAAPLPIDSTAEEITDNRLWNLIDLKPAERASGDAGFDYLPGTEREAAQIADALRKNNFLVQTHTSAQATEEALKALGRDTVKSPDILHIATHGFFFPDPEKRREQRFGDENVFKWNENPLFRSGLALAGANAAWTGQPTPGNIEDGIVTAYEISHLNLSNTKLVVLSACETGLGDIKGSEGVYGLQRAFKMAGVDHLIVSLWKVPDAETAEFMDVFYKNWLGGKTIRESFAKAQKKMRKKYKEVYKWGAWVLVE